MRRAGRHRNIVQLLGTCTVNECLVMIMEYIPCGDLVSDKLKIYGQILTVIYSTVKISPCSSSQTHGNFKARFIWF